jgi:hypothetical protein
VDYLVNDDLFVSFREDELMPNQYQQLIDILEDYGLIAERNVLHVVVDERIEAQLHIARNDLQVVAHEY